ncbi:MAG TPA: RIP metalloprotease RseP [bacterium]|nr:RIP metalloprotease RseP [bacterium]
MLEAVLRLIIVLGVLVFVHELGHFLLAKLVGIRVERFSLGFPPRMVGKKIGDTDYCISWIPLGGYVKMSGMIDESMDAESIKGEPWEFMSKAAYQRFLVIFAGPLMNIMLAVLLFASIAYFVGMKEPTGLVIDRIDSQKIQQQTSLQYGDQILTLNERSITTFEDFQRSLGKDGHISLKVRRDTAIVVANFPAKLLDSLRLTLPPLVGNLVDASPAQAVGLREGDRIFMIDETPVRSWDELTKIIHASPEQPLNIHWQRNGDFYSAEITPKKQTVQEQEIGLIGISYPVQERRLGLLKSVGYGFDYSVTIVRLTYHYLKLVIRGDQSFREAFGGPIMIAKMAKDSAREGESNFIVFIAFISLNLGLINLLPIPVLDGGHLLFLLVETIIRRPIPNKTKLVIQQVGMVILIAFMLFVIVNDIGRLRQ